MQPKVLRNKPATWELYTENWLADKLDIAALQCCELPLHTSLLTRPKDYTVYSSLRRSQYPQVQVLYKARHKPLSLTCEHATSSMALEPRPEKRQLRVCALDPQLLPP